MKIIQAGKFKAQCLALLDEVAQSHNPIVVTKHGKPVAKIVPIENQSDNEKNHLEEV
jgi:prevent-host-death family protein